MASTETAVAKDRRSLTGSAASSVVVASPSNSRHNAAAL
jgi:hypothetical protein